MAEQGLFIITDASALPALSAYAAKEAFRGKAMMETARKVFAFLVSFAMAKIPNGDPQKIRLQLTAIVARYTRLSSRKRKSKLVDSLRGTLAAKLVRVLNYLGARAAKGAAFYRLVRRFINARAFSARLHRAGLYPALAGSKARGVDTGGRLPKYRHMPGSYTEDTAAAAADILAENWASAHGPRAAGIVGLAGFAFAQAMPEVDALLTKYLLEDMAKAAASSGLSAA